MSIFSNLFLLLVWRQILLAVCKSTSSAQMKMGFAELSTHTHFKLWFLEIFKGNYYFILPNVPLTFNFVYQLTTYSCLSTFQFLIHLQMTRCERWGSHFICFLKVLSEWNSAVVHLLHLLQLCSDKLSRTGLHKPIKWTHTDETLHKAKGVLVSCLNVVLLYYCLPTLQVEIILFAQQCLPEMWLIMIIMTMWSILID